MSSIFLFRLAGSLRVFSILQLPWQARNCFDTLSKWPLYEDIVALSANEQQTNIKSGGI